MRVTIHAPLHDPVRYLAGCVELPRPSSQAVPCPAQPLSLPLILERVSGEQLPDLSNQALAATQALLFPFSTYGFFSLSLNRRYEAHEPLGERKGNRKKEKRSQKISNNLTMDIHEAYQLLNSTAGQLSTRFQQVPGSAILLRYIKSSYQNDPVRSVVELGLFLFAVRYLLAPRYSTNKSKAADLTEEVRNPFVHSPEGYRG